MRHQEISDSRPVTRKAVIFDVDGVLVDSYEAHLRSWQMLASECGLRITEAQFAATFGRTSRDIIRSYWNPALSDDQIARLDDRKEAMYRELVAHEFPAMEGAAELIDSLHKAGFALAAASSGPPENVDLALDRLDRRKEFSAVVTGRDVLRGKPIRRSSNWPLRVLVPRRAAAL
jgi:beta-phosphoglucomutase